MAKIAEATNRLFKNVFVCKNCKTKLKSKPIKILKEEVRCKKCGKTSFRPLRKK